MRSKHHMIQLAVWMVCLTIWAAAPASAGDYAHKITSGNVDFEWTVNGPSLDIRLTAPTTSWVGIGFNPTSMMKDANFIVGYVKKGKVKVTDEYGKSSRTHESDTKAGGTDNVTAVSGSEVNGKTTIAFTIPLNSGDPKDQALNVNGDTTVLLAYSGSNRDSFRSRHKEHHVLSVNLSTGAYKNTHKH